MTRSPNALHRNSAAWLASASIRRELAKQASLLVRSLVSEGHPTVLPTDEGAALFADVERAFIGLHSLEKSAENIRRGGTERLRIAAVPSLSLTVLPRIIQRFRQENPDVAISLHTSDSPMVAHWAASQFCDLGLASYVGEEMPGVKTQAICDVPGVCVFPKGYRLSALASVGSEDLKGEEFISLSHNDSSRARVDRALPED